MKILTTIITLLSISFGFSSCRTALQKKSVAVDHTRHELIYDGYKRYFLVYKPENYDITKKMPLLFALHGGGGIPENMVWLTDGRFNELADKYGFLMVYPEGYDKGWNDGRVGDHSTSSRENIDDVGFINQIVKVLSANYNIDTSRVFTCGISNGGFMSSRLACEASGTISGAAIVTATLGKEFSATCSPAFPINIMIINGTEDPLVPYEGGYVKVFKNTRGLIVPTEEYAKSWARRDKCDSEPEVISVANKDQYDGTTTQIVRWSGGVGESRVWLVRVVGGGHTWPGGKQYLGEKMIGRTSRDFSACELIVDFFGLKD